MSKLEMGTRRIFHRQQLLFVAKEAILHCPSRGLDPLTSPAWGGLGVSFLMANDHLHFSHPSPDDSDEKMVNTLADLIPVGEYSGWHSVINKITRSYLMSTRILDSMRKHSDFVDLNTEFSKIAGITPIEYQSLCFGALSKYIRMDIASYRKHPQSFLLPRTFFNPTHIVQERVDQFLEDLSSTPEKFREAFGKRNVGHNDFTSLRDKPLFQQEDNFYAIDAGFLAEKLETGAFWRVHNSYNSNRDKKRLHAFWGAVFQEYSNWLVRNSVDGVKNRFFPLPKYVSDGDEVCDGLIICGSSVALLEYKGSTFTAQAKYGAAPQVLVKEIEEKLVESRKGERKGVLQLSNAVVRLFGRGSSDSISGVDLSGVQTIYPVLVTRDDLGGALVINAFLNRRFRNVLNPKMVRPRTVPPLFCLSSEALEVISGYLGEARFTDILEARYRSKPTLMSTFLAVDNAVINKIGKRRNKDLDAAFDEFRRGLIKSS